MSGKKKTVPVIHYTYMPGETASELCGNPYAEGGQTGDVSKATCVECLRVLVAHKKDEIVILREGSAHKTDALHKELLVLSGRLSERERELASMRMAAHDAASALTHATEVATK